MYWCSRGQGVNGLTMLTSNVGGSSGGSGGGAITGGGAACVFSPTKC